MSRLTCLLAFCFAACSTLFSAAPASAQFTANELVLFRVGDGTALSSSATAVFFDRFSTTGTPLGTINVPSAGVGAITNAGTSTSEGSLTLSTNGQFLVWGGYGADAGTLAIAATTGAVAPRTIGRIDAAGAISTSSMGTAAYSAGNIRGAASTNGIDIWTSGTAAGLAGGTQYHAFGSGTATQVSSAPTNTRVVQVFNNQVYMTSASGTFQGVSSVGTGLPMASGETTTILPGFPIAAGPSNYGFVGLNNPLNTNSDRGLNTIYVADDRTTGAGGIQRWVFDGTNWTSPAGSNVQAGTGAGSGVRGLTASVSGSTVTLYGTTTETTANRVVSITDVLTASSGTFNPAGFTLLANAPAGAVYRGISFSPVPEPVHILLVGAGLAGIWRLRRKLPRACELV